jgi:hypothetical protein
MRWGHTLLFPTNTNLLVAATQKSSGQAYIQIRGIPLCLSIQGAQCLALVLEDCESSRLQLFHWRLRLLWVSQFGLQVIQNDFVCLLRPCWSNLWIHVTGDILIQALGRDSES